MENFKNEIVNKEFHAGEWYKAKDGHLLSVEAVTQTTEERAFHDLEIKTTNTSSVLFRERTPDQQYIMSLLLDTPEEKFTAVGTTQFAVMTDQKVVAELQRIYQHKHEVEGLYIIPAWEEAFNEVFKKDKTKKGKAVNKKFKPGEVYAGRDGALYEVVAVNRIQKEYGTPCGSTHVSIRTS